MTAGLHSVLAERYRLDELLAVGGMGAVWRATDTVLHRSVAVKTLKPEYVQDDDFRSRFRAEARHAAGLSHPGIASVYDFGEAAEGAWLVMELVEGEPLSKLLHREGALPIDRVLDLVAQTAAALQVAHDGALVHRDVKPGNLMVRPDGQVKVTDFGIASVTDAAPVTRTGEVVGTAHYLSPEQVAGSPAGPASDLYALGIVAYECLAGARPFAGDNPVAVAVAHLRQEPPPLPDTIPPQVSGLVARLLAKDPAERPVSAAQVAVEAVALRTVASSDDPVTTSTPLHEPDEDRVVPGSDRRSQRYALRAIAVTLALLVALLGLRSTLAADDLVVVPALDSSMSEAEAVAALAAAGLQARREQESSAQAPEGRLVRTDPQSGAEVSPGSSVLLVVSTGPPDVIVTSASLIGLPAMEAEAALLNVGLRARLVYDGDGQPVGTVAAVEPVGEVAVGDEVLLRIVPEPSPVPSPAAVTAPAPEPPPAVDPAPAPAPAPLPAPADTAPGDTAPGAPGDNGRGRPANPGRRP